MAFRKTLAYRLFHIEKISSPSSSILQSPLSNPAPATTTFNRDFLTTSDSGEKGFIRRFLHKRAICPSKSTESTSTLLGDRLREKLNGISIVRDRISFDGLIPPPKEEKLETISIEDAKKLIRISQLELLKSKLKRISKDCISYEEFVEICVESSNPDQGLRFAKMLDESGSVIVLGNSVFLRPEQVTRAIEGLIPLAISKPNDPRWKELEEMEKEKMEMDREAESLVRKELWAGLGFIMAQTAGFMRLTFWELSWDVMEPICFFVTSIYFMAGYAFFLRTAKEPSFEGFYESRFHAKQKKIMKRNEFDVERFNELRKIFYPCLSEPLVCSSFRHSDRALIRALQH